MSDIFYFQIKVLYLYIIKKSKIMEYSLLTHPEVVSMIDNNNNINDLIQEELEIQHGATASNRLMQTIQSDFNVVQTTSKN